MNKPPPEPADDNRPCEAPLIEQLRSVPKDAREMIEVGPCHHRNIPYGNLCHKAADRLTTQQRELAELRRPTTSGETPRTDALKATPMTRNDSDDFARQLERELAAANARVAELEGFRSQLIQDVNNRERAIKELETELARLTREQEEARAELGAKPDMELLTAAKRVMEELATAEAELLAARKDGEQLDWLVAELVRQGELNISMNEDGNLDADFSVGASVGNNLRELIWDAQLREKERAATPPSAKEDV